MPAGDERAASDCPQNILFVVPVPQCELSLFESGRFISATQKIPLQCTEGRRSRFKGERTKEKERLRKGKRSEKKHSIKLRGKIEASWCSGCKTVSLIIGWGLNKGADQNLVLYNLKRQSFIFFPQPYKE